MNLHITAIREHHCVPPLDLHPFCFVDGDLDVLARFAGMFKDDPLFDRWQKSIAKYRREADADPEYR